MIFSVLICLDVIIVPALSHAGLPDDPLYRHKPGRLAEPSIPNDSTPQSLNLKTSPIDLGIGTFDGRQITLGAEWKDKYSLGYLKLIKGANEQTLDNLLRAQKNKLSNIINGTQLKGSANFRLIQSDGNSLDLHLTGEGTVDSLTGLFDKKKASIAVTYDNEDIRIQAKTEYQKDGRDEHLNVPSKSIIQGMPEIKGVKQIFFGNSLLIKEPGVKIDSGVINILGAEIDRPSAQSLGYGEDVSARSGQGQAVMAKLTKEFDNGVNAGVFGYQGLKNWQRPKNGGGQGGGFIIEKDRERIAFGVIQGNKFTPYKTTQGTYIETEKGESGVFGEASLMAGKYITLDAQAIRFPDKTDIAAKANMKFDLKETEDGIALKIYPVNKHRQSLISALDPFKSQGLIVKQDGPAPVEQAQEIINNGIKTHKQLSNAIVLRRKIISEVDIQKRQLNEMKREKDKIEDQEMFEALLKDIAAFEEEIANSEKTSYRLLAVIETEGAVLGGLVSTTTATTGLTTLQIVGIVSGAAAVATAVSYSISGDAVNDAITTIAALLSNPT